MIFVLGIWAFVRALLVRLRFLGYEVAELTDS
jgi:hypothetical protein